MVKKWTKEKCHVESLKFLYKNDFKKYSNGAYQASLRNNWHNEICSHMLNVGNEYKRLIYRIIFPNNVCYVGLTSNLERRIREHLKKGVICSYIKENNVKPIFEKITDYINVDDAKILEEFWKNKSEEEGYLCLNIAKTGGLGSFELKWTYELCKNEAKKYKNRYDYQSNSHSSYNSALKNKWLDDICSHMIQKRKKRTFEECKSDALKYKNRGEYAKLDHNSWDVARKNGWLSDICHHMIELKKPKNYWTIDRCVEESLKYKSPIDLKNNKPNVYKKLCKNNLIKNIFKNK